MQPDSVSERVNTSMLDSSFLCHRSQVHLHILGAILLPLAPISEDGGQGFAGSNESLFAMRLSCDARTNTSIDRAAGELGEHPTRVHRASHFIHSQHIGS